MLPFHGELEESSTNSSESKPSSPLIRRQLYPYQKEIAVAVLDSVLNKKGLTFSVEIARQGGKNELSAQLELLLLTLSINKRQNLVKCSPTFKPQTVVSMLRLEERLEDAGYNGHWECKRGYIICLGKAHAIFLSAEESANVVGNTAHLLLEIDEAQDVNKDKYSKDFKPMTATTNCTVVHYGTTWNETTLLEEIKQTNLELEKIDGIRRHFRYDWQEVAKYNPDYLAAVEAEKQRLGETHPMFLTQYCLLPLYGGGGFLSAQQRAQLQGHHPRKHEADNGKIYVAGIDLAGEAEKTDDIQLRALRPRRDSTVITIGELDYSVVNAIQKQPGVKIVEHYRWTGARHTELYEKMIDVLKNIWRCKHTVVDATGVGQPVASFLQQALGSRITPFTFSAQSKSKIGFNLIAGINSGRLKMYTGDGSLEYQEFWSEMEKAKSQYRANQTMNFFVDPAQGHDDFLISLALVLEAADSYNPREAKGS
jgi:hypothetical protein